jgi:glucose/arabinose dehydrogenase
VVPDYLTMVQEGAFYGWPYSYRGQDADFRVHPQRHDLVAKAIKPDYGLSLHVAALCLAFSKRRLRTPLRTRSWASVYRQNIVAGRPGMRPEKRDR